ncbi:MAG TPA: SAM-dependent methyltransferase [Methylovirgula sp.]|jgi:SAM-dependent MidA family methyltransferase
MTPLEAEIAEIIAQDGPISLERFMALASLHQHHGYYRTRLPIGARGDFVTAPEVHQMFGELIGLWAAEMWRLLDLPQHINLIELGPGRGTLMSDVLRAARIVPDFARALNVHLVEASELLVAEQRRALADREDEITWHKDIDGLPYGPAIVLANEFFDALPVRHYIKGREGWHERLIGLDADGRLCFGLAPGAETMVNSEAEEGTILEIGLAGQRVMSQLAEHLAQNSGAALVIDYGYVATRAGETLQGVRGHDYADPLAAPGEVDLSAHVDFSALAKAARAAGAQVCGPITQGLFLSRLGIGQRAEVLKRKADPEQASAIDAALARLALPGPSAGAQASMADLFKVLAVTSPGIPTPPGFETHAARSGS